MADAPFVSFAQNGEDVVLWRVLAGVTEGRYIDVGANHPSQDSVTRAFYNRGWRGIAIEPIPHYAALLREERPGDVVIEAAITTNEGDTATLHEIPDTGLSTLDDGLRDMHQNAGYEVRDIEVTTRTLNGVLDEVGWVGDDIHFLTLDVEGSEAEVIRSLDLGKWRPWVLVIESVIPNGDQSTHDEWDDLVTSAGYRFCLFDGLSRFYLADERAGDIDPGPWAPANILDEFTTQREKTMVEDLQRAVTQSIAWKTIALERWSENMDAATMAAAQVSAEHRRLLEEYVAIQETISWRLTKPLRTVREHMSRKDAE